MSSSCCHRGAKPCDCYRCLREGFYELADKYNCEKKMAFYVINYGAAFCNEFYYYLNTSNVLNNFIEKPIKILSLGCGFAPDYYAIEKYIADKNLQINFSYIGYDCSTHWNSQIDFLKNQRNNFHFEIRDLTDLEKPLSFADYDLVVMCKVFSTIYKHKKHELLLQNIIDATNSMKKDAVFLFNDINDKEMGRDKFDNAVSGFLVSSDARKYYTAGYTGNNWTLIQQPHTIFKNVFFEYRKQI